MPGRASTCQLPHRRRCCLKSSACAVRGRLIGWPPTSVPSLGPPGPAPVAPPPDRRMFLRQHLHRLDAVDCVSNCSIVCSRSRRCLQLPVARSEQPFASLPSPMLGAARRGARAEAAAAGATHAAALAAWGRHRLAPGWWPSSKTLPAVRLVSLLPMLAAARRGIQAQAFQPPSPPRSSRISHADCKCGTAGLCCSSASWAVCFSARTACVNVWLPRGDPRTTNSCVLGGCTPPAFQARLLQADLDSGMRLQVRLQDVKDCGSPCRYCEARP